MSGIYYHFIRINDAGQAYLGYDDNRIVTVGETITVDGEPELCKRGLHASKRAIDALKYVPDGNIALCEVTLGGIVKHGEDKSVGTERTIVRMLTAQQTETILRAFARWCALSVAHLWDMPSVVREYLETGDERLRAAARAAAARAAARATAWQAAADAARAAARDAAADAARTAARDAAGTAPWAAAARAAAWAAARAAQNTKLIAMFEEASNE